MRTIKISLIISAYLCSIMLFLSFSSAADGDRDAPPAQVCHAIQNRLDDLTNTIDRLSVAMAGKPLQGEETQRLLLQTYESDRAFFSVVSIDRNLTLVAVAPQWFRRAIGQKTGSPQSVKKAFESGRAELSNSFTAAEGFSSCALNKAIEGGQGLVSATFNPSDVFANAIPAEFKLTVFILRAEDGVMEFSNHAENMNRSVLSDPKFDRHYADFQRLCRSILKEKKGTGAYHYKKFPTTDIVLKTCSWDTVTCGRRSWRVVQFHE